MWTALNSKALAHLSSRCLPILLDASVKGAVVLAAAGLVAWLMRSASAAARHLSWFLATVCLLLLPAASAVLPGWRVLPSWAALDAAYAPEAGRDGEGRGLAPGPRGRESTPPVLRPHWTEGGSAGAAEERTHAGASGGDTAARPAFPSQQRGPWSAWPWF